MHRLLLTSLALLLVLAACGDEDGPGNVSTSFTVGMTDFAYEPSDVSVPAGQEITVTVENLGSVEHNWIVLENNVQIAAESEIPEDQAGFALVTTARVQAGDSSTITFTAPEKGVYQIICDVPGHFTAGMEGRIGVEE